MLSLGIDAGKLSRKPRFQMLAENNVRQGFLEHGIFSASGQPSGASAAIGRVPLSERLAQGVKRPNWNGATWT